MSRGRWLAVASTVVAVVIALAATKGLMEDVRPVRPGSKAPGFRAVDVATGDTVSLADYEGDVVLLNVWATSCAPCEQEMPSMQRLHERLAASGLRIVAVSLDDAEIEVVREWVRARELTFTVLHERSGHIEQAYQITGWPESFIIDRDGVIVKKAWGAKEWDNPTEAAIFRRLLGLEVEQPDEPGGPT